MNFSNGALLAPPIIAFAIAPTFFEKVSLIKWKAGLIDLTVNSIQSGLESIKVACDSYE